MRSGFDFGEQDKPALNCNKVDKEMKYFWKVHYPLVEIVGLDGANMVGYLIMIGKLPKYSRNGWIKCSPGFMGELTGWSEAQQQVILRRLQSRNLVQVKGHSKDRCLRLLDTLEIYLSKQ